MPELPEVQTTVNELAKLIKGHKISGLWTDWPKIVRFGGPISKLSKTLIGRKITAVRRRAKYILLDLDNSMTLTVHQKMSGHLLYGKYRRDKGLWRSITPGALKDDPKNRFIRLIISFTNGYTLALSDLRRFGKIMLLKTGGFDENPDMKSLGPEPLEIPFKIFYNCLSHKRGFIKKVLLDQTCVAGIGNIYGDEILWAAGVHPLARTEDINEKTGRIIFKETNRILLKAIKMKGSSMDDYRIPTGEKGRYQNVHKVYQMTGKKCLKKDGGIIQRIRIAGRSSHFCPKHQKIIR